MLQPNAITHCVSGLATGAWLETSVKTNRWPLHDVQATRHIEQEAQSALPFHTLMQRAGLASAQLALAIAPHAQRIWIACGPGNNGGDGLEAAAHLQQWGKTPIVTCTTPREQMPADAQRAWQHAEQAGVRFEQTPPDVFDLALDALLGMGCHTAPQGVLAEWLQRLHHTSQTVLHIDIPSGLLANTGEWLGKPAVVSSTRQRHTLSLLTLKPGLFTVDGRDACGQVWFNDLGVDSSHTPPNAWLQTNVHLPHDRQHSSHKGSYGDVMVVGGTTGMAGAAVLASLAALHASAGRVYAGLLDISTHAAVVAAHPALMVREVEHLDFKHATVVCGCGGGDNMREVLPRVLSTAPRLVLDADALNALANDSQLFHLLQQRANKKQSTVLTPHPLEAARLLKRSTTDVQRDRLAAAQALAEISGCMVVLKGSGTVIYENARTTIINHSGNAKLATAGTGDVLAGLIGAQLANTNNPFEATCNAVYRHGALADAWTDDGPSLTASQLVNAIR
jgi:hydroxyethylthiazole kinase-like uncharacterized protein yjeF